MGPITPEERALVRSRSPVGASYDTAVNRDSAAEMLAARAAEKTADGDAPVMPPAKRGSASSATPAAGKAPAPAEEPRSKLDEFLWGTKRRQGAVEAAAKSATRTVATGLGRQILRGVLGGLLGGKKR